ncbi:hypothetical protein ACP70R_022620 [Stipagrostis hirtigluma subsp. patula]
MLLPSSTRNHPLRVRGNNQDPAHPFFPSLQSLSHAQDTLLDEAAWPSQVRSKMVPRLSPSRRKKAP